MGVELTSAMSLSLSTVLVAVVAIDRDILKSPLPAVKIFLERSSVPFGGLTMVLCATNLRRKRRRT